MLTLVNQSPWQAKLYSGWDQHGRHQLTCVIKASYHWDQFGNVTPMAVSQPIQETDSFHDTAQNSSLALANEVMPYKQGAELLLTATAYPAQPTCRVMEVSIELARMSALPWKKKLRVYGRRYWRARFLQPDISTPEPLSAVPLRYEYAYGGCDPRNQGAYYPYNPVGLGFMDRPWQLKQGPLPQLEQGPSFIRRPNARPMPAGFGPIPSFWQPRFRQYVGLVNSENLCPHGNHPPADLYNVAPVDQQFAIPFIGGEVLQLQGLSAEQPTLPITITVPNIRPRIVYAGSESMLPWDTLHIDSDSQTLHQVTRLGIPWELAPPFEKGCISSIGPSLCSIGAASQALPLCKRGIEGDFLNVAESLARDYSNVARFHDRVTQTLPRDKIALLTITSEEGNDSHGR